MSKNLAEKYLALKLPIVPVPYKQKGPILQGWPDLVISEHNVSDYFDEAPKNVSVLLGKEESRILDLDLDCLEAVKFGGLFSPKTGFVYGHLSKPNSHMLYRSVDEEVKSARFEHPEMGVLLEIRGKGCCTLLPGSTHPNGEVYEPFPASAELAQVSGEELYRSAALIAVCSLMTIRWPATGSRNSAALGLSGMLCKAGYDADQVVSAVYHVAKHACDEEADKRREAASDTVKKHASGGTVGGISILKNVVSEDVSVCLAKWLKTSPAEEISEAVEKMNEKYAFIIVGGGQRIVKFGKDPISDTKSIEFMKVDAFRGLNKNPKLCVGLTKNGPLMKSIGEVWLDHPKRRSYESLTFEPGREVDASTLNFWQGMGVEPDPGMSCELFLEHLHKIVCNGDEDIFFWLVGWLAQMAQNPGEKPGTAVIMTGPQGAGKTCVGEYIGEMFKPHYLKISNSKHLLGNFNAHQQGIVFLLCEEAFLAGDKSTQGVLKDLITSPDMLVERKGVDAVKAKNCLHLMATSNNPWVISADTDERRFLVLEVSGEVANDWSYFATLKHEQENGGPAGLLAFLLSFDYSKLDLHKPPITAALIAQKLESLDPLGKIVYKFLCEGHIHAKSQEWPLWIETEQFCDISFAGTKKIGQADKSLQTKFGMNIQKYLGPLKKEKKTIVEVDHETGVPINVSIGGNKSQKMVYILPDLQQCRTTFTARTGIDFPED